MSLVAYYSSSEGESENDEPIDATVPPPSNVYANGQPSTAHHKTVPVNVHRDGQISDEEDHLPATTSSLTINLPKPSKPTNALQIEEEDDEFLHKTVPAADVEKPPPPKPIARSRKSRQPVKITIPSLRDFDTEVGPTVMNQVPRPQPAKGSSLMNLLPPPKVSLGGGKGGLSASLPAASGGGASKPAMIPHAVKKKMDSKKLRPTATATTSASTSSKSALPGLGYSDDSDDGDTEDFFSLSESKKKLPEISAKEIQNMVARKSASLAAASQKLDKDMAERKRQAEEEYEVQQQVSASRYAAAQAEYRKQMDLQALCGSQAKRARNEQIEFIEISQEDVLPTKDEWLRSQLTGATEYQPKGLVGYDEPGGKKKHQITYLAYQAKANEAELQAMWSANRNSRQQTQNKYGF